MRLNVSEGSARMFSYFVRLKKSLMKLVLPEHHII